MESAETILLPEEAKKFIELMKDYHAGDSQPFEFKKQEVYSALHRLEQNGLIAMRTEADIDDYVLRDAVHGSPLLIFATPFSNIVFTSLAFAQCCQAVLEENIQVLKIIS